MPYFATYTEISSKNVDLLSNSKIEKAYLLFTEIALLWNNVSASIDNAGRTGNQQELRRGSELLSDIAQRERSAMEILLTI